MKSIPVTKQTISSIKQWRIIALLWGFCEGTFFFVIPDVFISLLAITSMKKGMRAAGWTLVGSMIAALFLFFTAPFFSTNSFLLSVPLVSELQIDTAVSHLTEHGAFGVVYGPLTGIPHKIYSLHASHMNIVLLPYVLFSAVSRYARFMIVAIASASVAWLIEKKLKRKPNVTIATYIMFWIAVYISYFFLAL